MVTEKEELTWRKDEVVLPGDQRDLVNEKMFLWICLGAKFSDTPHKRSPRISCRWHRCQPTHRLFHHRNKGFPPRAVGFCLNSYFPANATSHSAIGYSANKPVRFQASSDYALTPIFHEFIYLKYRWCRIQSRELRMCGLIAAQVPLKLCGAGAMEGVATWLKWKGSRKWGCSIGIWCDRIRREMREQEPTIFWIWRLWPKRVPGRATTNCCLESTRDLMG